MPELPEVETVCIGLSEKLLKLTVLDVKIINKKLRYQINSKNIKKIIKKKIKAVIRRGKNGLIIFSDNCILNFHLGMTGKFRIIKKKNNEKKHDHFIIIFNKNTKLIYNDVRKFGYVELIEKPLDLFQFKKLGVEPEMVKEQADVLFEKINRRNTNIKSILLDQSFICGIGNIYANEILFNAKISPFKKGALFKKREFITLLVSIRKILKMAIEKGGSSIKNFTAANDELGYFQTEFKVYNREGHPCHNCDKLIIRKIQNGRSSFYCESCQET